ncbi:MAG: hypothetical protein AB4368_08960 [Xenococcaceae cyanobacterium]
MSQSTQKKLSSKVLEKTIYASIKQEIAAASINTTTRKGNKELKFLTNKIAKYPFDNIEKAQIAGTVLGQHIAKVSQQRGKKNLDGGIIQQMLYQKELFSLIGLSSEKLYSDGDSFSKENSTSINSEQPREKIQSGEFPVNGEPSLSEEAEIESNREFQASEQLSPSSADTTPDTPEAIENSQGTFSDSVDVNTDEPIPEFQVSE